MVSSLLIGLMGLVVLVGLAVLLLYLRDRIAKAQGKTMAQVQARCAAILQFRSTLQYCIPGVLTIVFGIFWVLDRSRQHESDWWIGLPFIPAGWLLILLLARRSWRRYLELQQIAEKGETDATGIGSTPPKIG
jgi:ABC-type Fe3+ transport system permease subunit